MRTTIKLLLTALFGALSTGMSLAQSPAAEVVTFRFLPEQDAFYVPWGGNGAELARLYSLVDQYRTEITAGRMPVHVDGYCASLPAEQENRHMAFIRANRVKSELITNKGLGEDNFITRNHATAYEGHRDMVVVTLHIPAKAEEPKQEVVVVEQPKPEEPEEAKKADSIGEKPEPVAEPQPEPQPETQAIAPPSAAPAKPYCFAIRTNLLYDAFLLPTLGVEWRINPGMGIKVDGSRSWWGDGHGKVQKIWLVSPEVRWYLLDSKRFYVGASANFGEYNIYKGMLGGLFSDDTGYQGKLWGAGLTVGYQLKLSRAFSLDFNLGLGYTSLEYDSFNMAEGVRVYKAKDKSKDFFGPTQAGISFVWTIGGNK